MMCVMWGYCVFGVTLAGEGKNTKWTVDKDNE